jgi:hypothetical protein
LAQSDLSDSYAEISKEVENSAKPRITAPLSYEADFNDWTYKAAKDILSLNKQCCPSG